MTTDLTIRRASPADAERLGVIWLEAAEAFAKADTRYRLPEDGAIRWVEALHGWLTRDDMAVFVAEREGKVLGYIVGAVTDNLPGLLPARCGVVSDVAVDFHAKQGRIGREMLDTLKGWFREQGLTHVEARVPYRHPIAQAFWRAIGAGKVAETMWLRV